MASGTSMVWKCDLFYQPLMVTCLTLIVVFFFAKTPGVVLRYSDSAKKGIGKEKCQKDKGWTSAPNLNYRSKQGTVYTHVVSNWHGFMTISIMIGFKVFILNPFYCCCWQIKQDGGGLKLHFWNLSFTVFSKRVIFSLVIFLKMKLHLCKGCLSLWFISRSR